MAAVGFWERLQCVALHLCGCEPCVWGGGGCHKHAWSGGWVVGTDGVWWGVHT